MRIESSFDVVVVGSGVTGLATAYHLLRLGVQRVALAGPGVEPAASSQAAGMIAGGQVDNFTRVAQAHTPERATALWRYGDAGFDALVAYLEKTGVKHVTKRRLRLVTTPAELHEVDTAVKDMVAHGIRAKLLGRDECKGDGTLLGGLKERILSVQDDGVRGGWVEPQALLEQLTRDTAAIPRLGLVEAIDESQGHPQVRLAGGRTVACEIVVAAAHLQIRQLLPDLAAALVSYADQWSEWAVSGLPSDVVGTAFSANNTYEWGVFSAPERLRFGGARYLRPMAGIEAAAASVEPKITAHLLGKLQETFAFAASPQLLSSHALLDISPCDELPLVGPLYGSSRVIVATGFMGAGLTAGFWAGKVVADLIAGGQAPDLPRFLWPERLRTLSS